MDRAVVITAAVITAVRAAIRRRQSRREWPVPPAAPRMRRRHDSARAAAAPWRRCAVSPATPISRRARSSAAPAVRRSSSLSRRRGFPPQGGVLRPGLVARVPADQALAQWRARRDDQHLATFAIDLQPGRLRAEEHCSPAAVGVQQGDQRGELDALFLVEIAQHQVAVQAQRLADLLDPARLPGGQVGRFQAEGVVLVLGDVLFVGCRLMGGLRGADGDFQVRGELFRDQAQQLFLVYIG